jgi:NAD(P)-dependent dehydrogenase (short-subunit alcohol dehydrogenase family)
LVVSRKSNEEEVMGQSLSGKVAIVTGAGRGIGRGIAEALAAEGALVAVNYAASRAPAEALVGSIEAAGGQAFSVAADVGKVEEILRLYATVDAELKRRTGEARFDILVNNAGVGGRGTFDTLSEADYDRIFDINTKGVFFMCQQALSRIKDGGRIINISSLTARGAGPDFPAYAASKAAVNSLTVSLAMQLGPRRINVNSIMPGMTDTDLIAGIKANPAYEQALIAGTAMRRMGTVADIADALMLLVSDGGRWITGQNIEVSGGVRL